MRLTRALCYREHGKAREVLRLEEIELPEMTAGRALVKTLAAPIHPADFGQVAGVYAILKPFPAVGGTEGLGEIVEAGDRAGGLKPGDWVRLPASHGTWREHLVAEADELLPVPCDLPVEQAAMAFVNPPTAWRMLHDFVPLEAGDWIVQNAAASAVGHYVIQLARRHGWRTFNVVRDDHGVAAVRKAGGDAVATEGTDLVEALREATGERWPRLGLNSVGGESAVALIRTLAHCGTLVTFGGMTGEKVRFPTRRLIFDDIRLRGFWMTRWLQEAPPAEVTALYQHLFDLIRNGHLHAPVAATYSLTNYQEALAHASRPARGGKILFVGE